MSLFFSLMFFVVGIAVLTQAQNPWFSVAIFAASVCYFVAWLCDRFSRRLEQENEAMIRSLGEKLK